MFNTTSFSKPLKLFTALACAAALATPTAAAQEQKDEGGYFGFGFGQATLVDFCDSVKAELGDSFASCEDSEIFFRAFGGYRLNPYIAGELGIGGSSPFWDTYEVRVTNGATVDTTYTSLNAGVELSHPFTDNFSVSARGGMHYWELEVSAAGAGSVTDDGTDPYYGGGAEYLWDDGSGVAAAFGVDYTRYTADDDNVDAWEVSIKLIF